ncbi:hypothetical protein [Corynebacterium comes]|uniref:hypothetical protein n=1 Tax=Corynebacterium comes TaxID=2675218 RepID=UPI0012E19E0D|nr:hypothetical protein [Corynebacterium comes]
MIERRVESEIQAAVLRGLFDADASGARRYDSPLIKKFPGGLAGFFLGDGTGFPWPELPTDEFPPLTPSDHTVIIRAIMENAFAVIKHLDDPRSRKPDGAEVLRAALKVGGIADWVKDLISAVLSVLEQIDAQRGNEPAAARRAVDDLRDRLQGLPLDRKIELLRGEQGRYRSNDGMAEGMELAASILEDGASTIYSADFPFNRMLTEGSGARKPSLGATADADGVGGVAGALIGTPIAGVGAGPGAVAGGAAASAAQIITDCILWIFD